MAKAIYNMFCYILQLKRIVLFLMYFISPNTNQYNYHSFSLAWKNSTNLLEESHIPLNSKQYNPLTKQNTKIIFFINISIGEGLLGRLKCFNKIRTTEFKVKMKSKLTNIISKNNNTFLIVVTSNSSILQVLQVRIGLFKGVNSSTIKPTVILLTVSIELLPALVMYVSYFN